MAGKKVIITGVPGVGKTTVINEALNKLKSELKIMAKITVATIISIRVKPLLAFSL